MIRRATLADVPALVAIKEGLTLARGSRGGFLLGVDEAGYRARVAMGGAWVLDGDAGVVGFAIVLPDAALRGSDLWARRGEVAWTIDPAPIEEGAVAYFDQLALRRDAPRRWAAPLALAPVLAALDAGVDRLVATTVVAPVENRAAVPFLERLGAVRAGRIDERYEGVGDLVSEVWVAARADIERALDSTSGRWARSLARAAVRG